MKKYVGQMNVLGHKHTFTRVREYEGGGSQTFPNGNHFGSWNFKVFWIFGTKLQMEKLVQIEHSLYHLKVLGM
jgi:hypothetical protein